MAICIFIHDMNEPTCYKFMKRIRVHYQPIIDLVFIPLDSNTFKMITIGEDRYLIEYDIKNM